jgi:hypothetical protein
VEFEIAKRGLPAKTAPSCRACPFLEALPDSNPLHLGETPL